MPSPAGGRHYGEGGGTEALPSGPSAPCELPRRWTDWHLPRVRRLASTSTSPVPTLPMLPSASLCSSFLASGCNSRLTAVRVRRSRFDADGAETVYVSRVDENSPADHEGIPVLAEVVEINGRSARGLSRAEVAQIAARRPFSLRVRVHLAPIPPGVPPGAASPLLPTSQPAPPLVSAPAPPSNARSEFATHESRSSPGGAVAGARRRASPRRQQRSGSPFRRLLGGR